MTDGEKKKQQQSFCSVCALHAGLERRLQELIDRMEKTMTCIFTKMDKIVQSMETRLPRWVFTAALAAAIAAFGGVEALHYRASSHNSDKIDTIIEKMHENEKATNQKLLRLEWQMERLEESHRRSLDSECTLPPPANPVK